MENVSVIYLITLKLGADLFAVTMFVELRAARLSPTVAWLDVCEAKDKMSFGLYKQRALPLPSTVKESVLAGLGKHCIHRIFLSIYLPINYYRFQPRNQL